MKFYSLTKAGARQLRVEVANWEKASALVIACAAMIGIALAAGLVPASRATRVHPISVLRDEG